MDNLFVRAFLQWLPVGAAVTLLLLAVYGTVQQNFRQSANDPQIQLAEDAALALGRGVAPSDVVPGGVPIDISQSLAPFVAVYDKNGSLLKSSGTIGTMTATPPVGVFADAHSNVGKDTGIPHENRVTWQPTESTRIALVVVEVPGESGMFASAGRNLREVEVREANLSFQIFVAWVASMLGTLIAMLVAVFLKQRLTK